MHHLDTGDEDDTGTTEIKKLDEDVDLQENVDEEKEGKDIAEEIVRGMDQPPDNASESDADEAESVSVMHQVDKASTSYSTKQTCRWSMQTHFYKASNFLARLHHSRAPLVRCRSSSHQTLPRLR